MGGQVFYQTLPTAHRDPGLTHSVAKHCHTSTKRILQAGYRLGCEVLAHTHSFTNNMHVLDDSLLIRRVFVLRATQLYISCIAAVLPSDSALQ